MLHVCCFVLVIKQIYQLACRQQTVVYIAAEIDSEFVVLKLSLAGKGESFCQCLRVQVYWYFLKAVCARADPEGIRLTKASVENLFVHF